MKMQSFITQQNPQYRPPADADYMINFENFEVFVCKKIFQILLTPKNSTNIYF